MTTFLNIGLNVGAEERLSLLQVINAVGAYAFVLSANVHHSDTERTAVLVIDRLLSTKQGNELAKQLNQEAFAMLSVRAAYGLVPLRAEPNGWLIGPEAAKWGAFNLDYFLMPDGRRASAALSQQ